MDACRDAGMVHSAANAMRKLSALDFNTSVLSQSTSAVLFHCFVACILFC
jgi:hypothetical protein